MLVSFFVQASRFYGGLFYSVQYYACRIYTTKWVSNHVEKKGVLTVVGEIFFTHFYGAVDAVGEGANGAKRKRQVKNMLMDKLNAIDEAQYKADFMISEGYIKFSGELLRISLVAMGGFGALVLFKFDKGAPADFLKDPTWFLVSMAFFALCSAAALFHRFYASDCMSWYIGWLRASNSGNEEKATKERAGLRRLLKLSNISLIVSEWLFGGGVLFFIVGTFHLFTQLR